jgi:MFS family permease
MAQASVVAVGKGQSKAQDKDYDSEFHYEAWTPRFNPWIVAFTVTLATFMEALDSSIANVALPHIAGTLGASYDEATWVLTSYLVSNAIVLPISGWIGVLVPVRAGYDAADADRVSRDPRSRGRRVAAE